MLAHMTPTGVSYEIYAPDDEALRRMSGMIRFLWFAYSHLIKEKEEEQCLAKEMGTVLAAPTPSRMPAKALWYR